MREPSSQTDLNQRFQARALGTMVVVIQVLAVALLLSGCMNKEAVTVGDKIFGQAQPTERVISPDQERIVEVFGYPSYFSIYYLPGGDDLLTRVDIWSFPEHEARITFVGGQIFEVTEADIDTAESTRYSNLRPDDFDYSMDYSQVAAELDADDVIPVDFANDLTKDEDALTYLADKVIFTIEKGHLVHLQTMGEAPVSQEANGLGTIPEGEDE